jgi:hypothetical protein
MPKNLWKAAALGHLVYEAYWQSWGAMPLAWERLPRRERMAWQHAAWQLMQEIGLVPRTSRHPQARTSASEQQSEISSARNSCTSFGVSRVRRLSGP